MKYNYKIYRISKTPLSINIDLYDETRMINFEIKFCDRANGMKNYKAIINYLNYQQKIRDDVNISAIIEGFEQRKIELNSSKPCPFLEPEENQ